MSGSWVTITTVVPSRFNSWNSAINSTEVRLSSAPVGSSASSIFGELTSARAIATRCCWPPESCGRAVMDALAEADARQRGDGLLLARLAVGLGIDHRQFDIGECIEPVEQIELLEDEADLVVAHGRRARRR